MRKVIGFLMCLLAAPANARSVEVQTFAGRVQAPVSPERIVVFDLAALDSLTALEVKPDGLPGRVYLPYLEEAAQGAQPVGSLFEPDFEAVFAMAPDLIIAGGRSAEQVPELARIAPTLDMTIWDNTVEDGLARLAAYGRIFDKQAQADNLTRAFNDKLEKAKAAVAGTGTALIVMTNGPKLSAYGAGGRFGWLHDALDVPEAIKSVEKTTHGEAISFEFIREANPDILFVIDRMAAIGQDGESARATLDNALVHETTAWKTGRVIYLSAAPIYLAGGGIQSMTLTVDEILTAFADR